MNTTTLKRALYCGLASLTLARVVGPAAAQDRFAVEAFDPAPDVDGSVLNVYGARTRAPGELSVTLLGSYARRPLSIENSATGGDLGDLVGSVGTGSLMGVAGLAERLDLSFALPLHRMSKGSSFGPTQPPALAAALVTKTKVALGDLRLAPRVSLVKHKGESGGDLALLLPIWLPTGDDDVYAGEPFRIEPRVALAHSSRRALLAANVGYLIRQEATVLDTRIDDMVRWGVGTDLRLGAGLSLLAELSGQINLLSNEFVRNDAPTEALGGLRARGGGWLGQFGGGAGVVRGPTAPTYRLFASVTFTGAVYTPVLDADRDGLNDDVDACPTKPEDGDGFEDSDGCPDPDNDGDGVLDASDRCPLDREDTDGFEDSDGCPDADDDQDGILDLRDACPRVAEDKDAFQDEDGCPDPDNDGDGILDGNDRCPNEVGVIEQAGCPAPPKAEPPPSLARLTEDRIELGETVYFETNKSVIQERSFALMDSVAQLLNEHSEVELVVVHGHTDSRGGAALNRRLSKERANSVLAALVQRGIKSERLRAEGFGPNSPIASNDTEEGRAQNRRVELHVERRGKPAVPLP